MFIHDLLHDITLEYIDVALSVITYLQYNNMNNKFTFPTILEIWPFI